MASTVRLKPAARVAADVRPFVAPVARRGANNMARLARQYAPKRTGRLSRSIRVDARGSGGRFAAAGSVGIASYEVSANTPYATYMEQGTAPHTIRVRNARVLTDGAQFFGTQVNHPGTRPYRYLARAASLGFKGL